MSESDLTKDEIALARRWAKAYDVARTAGFHELGDTDEVYLEVGLLDGDLVINR